MLHYFIGLQISKNNKIHKQERRELTGKWETGIGAPLVDFDMLFCIEDEFEGSFSVTFALSDTRRGDEDCLKQLNMVDKNKPIVS